MPHRSPDDLDGSALGRADDKVKRESRDQRFCRQRRSQISLRSLRGYLKLPQAASWLTAREYADRSPKRKCWRAFADRHGELVPSRLPSAACVARDDADLLEPIFERKCMFAPLGAPAGSCGLASRMFARRSRRSFGGRRRGRRWRASGRRLGGRCFAGRRERARQQSRRGLRGNRPRLRQAITGWRPVRFPKRRAGDLGAT